MASDLSFIEYVSEQLRDTGEVRYKKMFGEYMVYVDNIPTVLVCDNTPYLKKLDSIKSLMENSQTGFPYDGAKEHYILDIDDKEGLGEIIEKTLESRKTEKRKNKVKNF